MPSVACINRATGVRALKYWLFNEEASFRVGIFDTQTRQLWLYVTNNSTLWRARSFFCKEQIFVSAVKHGAEALVCNAQQSCGTGHAAFRGFERAFDQSAFEAQDFFPE